MKPVYLALLIGMNLIWAGTYPIYKVLTEQLSSGAIATLRFSMATACLLAAWRWLPGRNPGFRELAKGLVMGVIVFCLAPRLQIEGVHRGMAGDTSLLIALDPLIVALAAAMFLGERIAPRRWWGFGLGIVGVVLISRSADQTPLKGLLANLLFISSFVCEAAYSVMGKPMLGRVGVFKLLAVALCGGTIANLALEGYMNGWQAVAVAAHASPMVWASLIFMALVCTIAGYALWYLVIEKTEVNVTTLTVFIQPVAGLAMAFFWLGEPLHWGQLWGSLVIVCGLLIGLQPESVLPWLRQAWGRSFGSTPAANKASVPQLQPRLAPLSEARPANE